jgi:hypothetical protein
MQAFGKVKAALDDVRGDDGLHLQPSRRACKSTEAQTGTIYGSESNCKRFTKSTFKGHVIRKTVDSGGRVKMPRAKGSYDTVMAEWRQHDGLTLP